MSNVKSDNYLVNDLMEKMIKNRLEKDDIIVNYVNINGEKSNDLIVTVGIDSDIINNFYTVEIIFNNDTITIPKNFIHLVSEINKIKSITINIISKYYDKIKKIIKEYDKNE